MALKDKPRVHRSVTQNRKEGASVLVDTGYTSYTGSKTEGNASSLEPGHTKENIFTTLRMIAGGALVGCCLTGIIFGGAVDRESLEQLRVYGVGVGALIVILFKYSPVILAKCKKH